MQRLRLVDDALLSGNRSAARGLLEVWIAQARSMEGAGLLTSAHGTMLQPALGSMLPQIGAGSVKTPLSTGPWPTLPTCDSTTGAAGLGATQYEIWPPRDARVIVQSAVSMLPVVGKLLAPLVAIFWPASGAPDVSTLISATLMTQVSAALDGLKNGVKTFDQYENAWQADCLSYGTSST